MRIVLTISLALLSLPAGAQEPTARDVIERAGASYPQRSLNKTGCPRATFTVPGQPGQGTAYVFVPERSHADLVSLTDPHKDRPVVQKCRLLVCP